MCPRKAGAFSAAQSCGATAETPARTPADTLCTMFDGNEFQAEVASCRELPDKSLSNTVPSESQKSNDGGRTGQLCLSARVPSAGNSWLIKFSFAQERKPIVGRMVAFS